MSYAQQFSDQTQSYNAGLNSYFASVQANYETEVANAGRVGDDLTAFAELGQTVAGKLEERKNYLIKQSKLKYYNAARELVATGQFDLPSGESPEEKAEFNTRIDQAIKARQEGRSVEFGHKLLNIGKHDRRHFQQGLIADVAAQQDTLMRQIIKDEKLPTGTERELAGSMSTAFTKFMDQNLMNFDERVVFSAMPNFNKTMQKVKQSYTSANNIRNSEFTLQRTKAEFGLGIKDYSQSLKVLQAIVNPKNGKPYTSADANKIMLDHFKNLATQGALSKKVEDSYFNSKPSWANGRTLAELKPELKNEILYLRKQYIDKRTETEISRAASAANADANEITRQFNEKVSQGMRPDDAWEQEQLNEWRKKHVGQNEEWVTNLVTQQEFSQLERFEGLEEIAKRDGYIVETHPDLQGLSLNQRNILSPFIKSETDVKSISRARDFAEERIKAMVRSLSDDRGISNGEFTDQGSVIINRAMTRLNALVAEKILQGATYEQAYQNSAQDILDLFVRDPETRQIVIPPQFDKYLDNRVNFNKFTEDREQLGQAMINTPYVDLTPGQYQVPADVAKHLDDQDKGLIRADAVHPLIRAIADRDPRMSILDVKRWIRKNLSQPFKAAPLDESFDKLKKMSYVPGLEQPKSPSAAARNVFRFNSVNPDINPFLKVDFNHSFTVHPALQRSVRDPIRHAIAITEGNLDRDGNPTKNYFGHKDPGDGANNIGMFSASNSRQGVQFKTPEEADAHHHNELDDIRKEYKPVLSSYGVPITTDDYSIFMYNIEDLHIQAPSAVPDFVKSLRTVVNLGLRGDDLIAAVAFQRARAYINPETNRLETSFASFDGLFRDQWARAGTIVYGERRSYNETDVKNFYNKRQPSANMI